MGVFCQSVCPRADFRSRYMTKLSADTRRTLCDQLTGVIESQRPDDCLSTSVVGWRRAETNFE